MKMTIMHIIWNIVVKTGIALNSTWEAKNQPAHLFCTLGEHNRHGIRPDMGGFVQGHRLDHLKNAMS